MAGNKYAGGAGGGAAHGLGLIGALVYFLQSATSFWDGVYGVFQALVWPAFLVWGLLDPEGPLLAPGRLSVAFSESRGVRGRLRGRSAREGSGQGRRSLPPHLAT